MKAKLTNIYRMTGINTLPSDAPLRLSNDEKQGVQVYLTTDVQPLNDMLLQVAAAKNFGLSAFTGGLPGDTPFERYRTAYELLSKQPPLVESGATFLVVEVDGEGEGSSTGHLIDLGDIALWVDFGQGAFVEKASFDAKAEGAFHRAVVAFALAGKPVTPSFQKVGGQVYLIEPTTGRHIFPLSYSMFGRATILSAISTDLAQEVVAQIPAVAGAGNLDSVVRLLSQSFDERLLRRSDGDDDARDLMVFTLVWTALEKTIGKIYRRYTPAVPNLQPQVAAIAQALDPDNADDDIKKFGKLYQARQAVAAAT